MLPAFLAFVLRQLKSCGCGSNPCSPGEHQNRWQKDVHPPPEGYGHVGLLVPAARLQVEVLQSFLQGLRMPSWKRARPESIGPPPAEPLVAEAAFLPPVTRVTCSAPGFKMVVIPEPCFKSSEGGGVRNDSWLGLPPVKPSFGGSKNRHSNGTPGKWNQGSIPVVHILVVSFLTHGKNPTRSRARGSETNPTPDRPPREARRGGGASFAALGGMACQTKASSPDQNDSPPRRPTD